jgi:hypothetical protein
MYSCVNASGQRNIERFALPDYDPEAVLIRDGAAVAPDNNESKESRL